ncbi:MAG: hypothetical protein KatS3mg124_0490 [Porticoccaceae bacterium]|nr:MAG: hypothetical protein KatS3mg124_0490 [Porticoccaceae bacterium]
MSDPRPSLAFLSPLPPQASGIAVYAAHLLPLLARHYRIAAVLPPGVAAPAIPGVESWLPAADFPRHARDFDRLLYHLGNSPFHEWQLPLLAEHPGVVVLHDFFLGHLIEHSCRDDPAALVAHFYAAQHYRGAAAAHREEAVKRAVWDWPLNEPVLAHARGVIVHSPFNLAQRDRWLKGRSRVPWFVVPHLRAPAPPGPGRTAARRALGLPDDALVVVSFGHVTEAKAPELLLAAFLDSPLGRDPQALLAFAGEAPAPPLAAALETCLAGHPARERVRFTGWLDEAAYRHWLQAADLAVQLRRRSRGETSGAVLDCLAHGLPVIANRHGTLVDYPDDCLFFLPEQPAVEALADALAALAADPERRRRQAEAGLSHLRAHHDPEACAAGYREAIERSCAAPPPAEPLAPRRTLWVDCSALAHADLQSGVERVVRAQLLALIAEPPADFAVEPVYLAQGQDGWHFRRARELARRLLGLDAALFPLEDEPAAPQAGDRLYIPDLDHAGVVLAHEAGLFHELRDRGVAIHTLVHDLLPIAHPEWFPPGAGHRAGEWLAAVAEFSDQLIAPSRAVAAELEAWLAAAPLPHRPPVAVNPHGTDLAASAPSRGIAAEQETLLARLSERPFFLAVGTVEPRKGLWELLEACERLWRAGHDFALVVVGREGWRNLPDHARRDIPALAARLAQHPEAERRLWWLQDASDELLERLYRQATGLVMASHGEGFGLPVAEAAALGCPVLARDLPVFREVAPAEARFFAGGGAVLAAALEAFLRRPPPRPAEAARRWRDNAADLVRLLEAPPSTWPNAVADRAALLALAGETFVRACYRLFLGRPPSEVERRQLLAELRAGRAKADLAASLRYSGEARRRPQPFGLPRDRLIWGPGRLPLLGRAWRTLVAAAGAARIKRALDALAFEVERIHWEEIRAPQRALDLRLAALEAALAAAQGRSEALAREVAALRSEVAALRTASSAPPAAPHTPDALPDDWYAAFEAEFRGDEALVAERLAFYLPELERRLPPALRALPVADLGCGRGEWLALLAERGYRVCGVERNAAQARRCRERGLAVAEEDALAWLARRETGSLAALSAFHLVEHLRLAELLALLAEAHRALAPGGLLLLETPNPENLLTGACRFWTDPTHRRPLPPSLLAFLVRRAGFTEVEIHRLHPDREAPPLPEGELARRLEPLLLGPQDYGLVARRPER